MRGEPKLFGDVTKPIVSGPKLGAGGQPDRGKQVDIDIADATAVKRLGVDKAENLGVGRQFGARQIRQRAENDLALAHRAQGKFSNDEGMR